MSRDTDCLVAVQTAARRHGLRVKIENKNRSWLMRAFNLVIGRFNPRFMTGYATTVFGTIYQPDAWDARSRWRNLAHEVVHLDQERRLGWKYPLMYLFPQFLSALSLLAILAIWWTPMLWCLLFLAFLGPWPAPWRVRLEREAYVVTAACDVMLGVDVGTEKYLDYMVGHYSWPYWRMRWRLGSLKHKLRRDVADGIFIALGDESYGLRSDIGRAVADGLGDDRLVI